MQKKVILTEKQYDSLVKFINETKFDKVIKNVARVGDIIKIDYKNTSNNFKVVKNDLGQIQMDNIDSGSANINYRYFITQASLDGDDLELRRVHKIKEKDKLGDIKSWQRIEVRDIRNIELIRNGSIIDTVDTPTPSYSKLQNSKEKKQKGQPDNEEFKTKVDEVVLIFLNKIKEGNGLKINLSNNDVINLCCISQSKNNYAFTLDSKTKIDELNKWDTFGIEIYGDGEREDEDLYELNKERIKTTDGGETFNMRVRGFYGDKTMDIWIKGIKHIEPLKVCASKEVKPEPEKVEPQIDTWVKPKRPEDEAKAMVQAIMSDPIMKKAFYKQPTLWNMIVSAVNGKNPKGTGIHPALKIINQYKSNSIRKDIGPSGSNFKANKAAQFEILDKEVFINPTGQPSDVLRLEPKSLYRAIVNEYKLGDEYLTLSNKKIGFKIIIKKEYKNIPDAFEVTFLKVVEGKKTGEIKEYPKNAIIKFRNERGSGYSNDDTKNQA